MEPVKVVDCPGCGLPAEVLMTCVLRSTHGPVTHAQLRCIGGHHYLMPAEQLTR